MKKIPHNEDFFEEDIEKFKHEFYKQISEQLNTTEIFMQCPWYIEYGHETNVCFKPPIAQTCNCSGDIERCMFHDN